ncbi:MAG: hypothetical protein JW958_07075 [Candidatus Eisenbacteria bacterium]|nr:hypothetical protein [Candidatus Eisenbacteria bacterium]
MRTGLFHSKKTREKGAGRRAKRLRLLGAAAALSLLCVSKPAGELQPLVSADERGRVDAERAGHHDAADLRTIFYNFGMVGDYPPDPGNVDLSVFHSAEVPKGSGMNYCDGITPFVLAKITQRNGLDAYIMETGFRERQGISPYYNRVMRFEPRPGYFQADPTLNLARSPAVSHDPRTWPYQWPDRMDDPDDPGWSGDWNGYFGKRAAADQESYTVMDDDFYDAWDFYPDSRDSTRHGLGLRIEVRGFQWSNPQASNVIFWHYDITNEGTTDYNDNIIFGLYMDSGVGGSALSCDGIYESDDDNAYFDKSSGLNLVYTWDKYGHGVDLSGKCGDTGYLGYAYLETPGAPLDGIDNDEDGILNERRDGGPGEKIVGRDAIRAWTSLYYDMDKFEETYGLLTERPAYKIGEWWTGDEDMDWNPELHDVGADGVPETEDTGEGDGMPTAGEPYFDETDLNESDMIGLTGFKMNRIRAGQGNPNPEVDGILFYMNDARWPERLYDQFTDPNAADRFDSALAANYNIGFLFASGPFILRAGQTERFSLALAYGANLGELRNTVKTVQQIYDANYQFAVPPPLPTLTAETGDGFVRLSWDDQAEHGFDPVTFTNDFEGYRIYRSTDPEFRDPRVITTGSGTGPIGNGRPIAQFDVADSIAGYSNQTWEGVAYWLGDETGITHTWTDSTVTNGRKYYYAVTSYDYGSDSLGFYPSENSINVSRTPRGGEILPQNVVAVRPEPKVTGYVRAETDTVAHREGRGSGEAEILVVNSNLVPDEHVFEIRFKTPSEDSLRAISYSLVDSTEGRTVFSRGMDLNGEGTGPVGDGMLPVVRTPATVFVDSAASGFVPGGPTNTRLKISYLEVLPINLRRPGFPDDLTVTFSDDVVDTSLAIFPLPAKPAKFRVVARAEEGDGNLDFRFRDVDGDGTLSDPSEYVDVVTYSDGLPGVPMVTWRVQLDTVGQGERGEMIPPAGGDVYEVFLTRPYGADDVLAFRTSGERIDEGKEEGAELAPYVVPNPYVGSASFEAERYATSGRGERRIEFRGLPRGSTIRIYTVTGELVRTLHHDGSDDGAVAWDLRTKDNLDVAPGLYIYHVDAGRVGTHVGKFAIIK